MTYKKFNFEVNAVWLEDKTVKISSPVLNDDITTVIPPPFKNGVEGTWSAEHLFLASIASCFVHTFQYLAELSELPFENFSCSISGNVESVNNVSAFHKVQLYPTLIIPLETYRAKAANVLETMERDCIIKNSVKTEVSIEAKILVSERAVEDVVAGI